MQGDKKTKSPVSNSLRCYFRVCSFSTCYSSRSSNISSRLHAAFKTSAGARDDG